MSDGTIRYIFPSGVEESVYRDGTNIRVEKNGDMIKEFANGQREILTEAYKVEYAVLQGTVSIELEIWTCSKLKCGMSVFEIV